jgi:transposase
MPHIAAGVDCHKDAHVVAFLDPLGRVLGTLRVGQTAGAYAHAVEAARALGAAPGEVRWGLESTGSYGRRFANHLAAAGEVVYEVPSALTHRSRRHGRRLGKSDEIDARAIAEVVLREGDALGRHRGEGAHDELRLLYAATGSCATGRKPSTACATPPCGSASPSSRRTRRARAR